MSLWGPAAMTALIVIGIWGPNLMRPPPAWTLYASVKGQIRRVPLADKSVLRLNGASQARVVYEDRDRRAALGQAEAAFTITPDARRPFLIAGGDREARLVGGEVNVLRQTTAGGALTILTVRHGEARVYPQGQSPNEGLSAGPGQEVSWVDGQLQPKVRQVNADNAFAWESHRLAYDKAPLSAVVADLNRYVARPIRLGQADLAQTPYSGVLALEGEEAMLRKIAQVLPIEAHALPAEIVLVRRAPCPPRGCLKPAKRKAPALMQSLLELDKAKPKPHPLPVPPPDGR